MDRAAPDTARPVTATSPANAPSTTILAPVLPPEEEKNSDSSTIAVKSAMLAAASAVWPTWLCTWPASLSTGTTRPSAVAERMSAISSGCDTHPAAVNEAPAP